MNILPIVLSVLLVLSWASHALLQQHLAFRKYQNTFLSLQAAERSCHQKMQLESFRQLPGVVTKKANPRKAPNKPRSEKRVVLPEVNPPCARINLYPFVRDGIDSHPALLSMAKATLHDLYGKACDPKMLDALLHAIIQAANKKNEAKQDLSLETLFLKDSALQEVYYHLLKGMKRPNLFSNHRFPPLVDHFKFDPNPSTVCTLHAHPHALIPFFGKKGALSVFGHLAEKKRKVVTLDELFLAAKNPSLRMQSEEKWKLLGFSHPEKAAVSSGMMTTTEGEVSIRRPAH